MRAHRLKTYIWVQTQQRLCDQNALPFYILQKGDQDAGAVIIKINGLNGGCKVFSQIIKPNGEPAWQSWSTNGEEAPESEADTYIANQIKIDPDIWVIEINDQRGLYKLDGNFI